MYPQVISVIVNLWVKVFGNLSWILAPDIACITENMDSRWCFYYVEAIKNRSRPTSRVPKPIDQIGNGGIHEKSNEWICVSYGGNY